MAWQPRVVVIGAGAAGIAAAVRMRQDGVTDLLVVDRAEGVGGVWRDNTYPGAQCDVPSHLYSLSFHPKANWSRRFGDQDEILAYLQDVVRAHDLGPYLRFGTEVLDCRWDDDAAHWVLRLCDGVGVETEHVADVVLTATGQLSVPAVPDLEGLASFTGPVFHSARWRHDVDLTGRRVAVVGTGASAIQFVPPVAEAAAHVDVYQRSAPYLIGKPNRRYTRFEHRLQARFPALLKLRRGRQYLWHEALGLPFVKLPALMGVVKQYHRFQLWRTVRDPGLRAQLRPDYAVGCKRLLRTTDWYRTLTRPDVDVVTDAVAELTPSGLRTADGTERPADVVVLGTGFAATEFLTPMRVTGPGGRDLEQEWRDGARAYLGTAVAGFPNLFLLYGPGTNLGHSSILFMIESQLNWVRSVLAALRELDGGTAEVRPEAQTRYDAWFRDASAGTVWETGCSSWYTVGGRNVSNWPATTLTFRRRTRRFAPSDVLLTATRDLPRTLDLTTPHHPRDHAIELHDHEGVGAAARGSAAPAAQGGAE